MADISILSRIVQGIPRNVDLTTNSLVVDSIKVGGVSNTELTKTILDKLIALQNGTDFATGTNAHTHDGRYFTETEIGSVGATSGADRVGVNNTPSNYSAAAATVQDHLEGIDAALATAGGTSFSDADFQITDNTTPTKILKFQVSALTAATTRTITMPDADVDLGGLTNSNIASGAAIALSKLAALTFSRALVSDGSGVVSVSATTAAELGYVSGVTSSIQTQLNAKAADADVIKKDGSVAFTANQSMGSNKITNLSAGTAGTDAVNKAQMDAALEGLKPKAAARVATTADITIATALNAGDTIDGITLANGDRVLVKDQTAAETNGIYVVSATPARATDFDSLSPIDEINGAMIAVEEGTANAGKVFVQSGAAVATLDTDPINFVFFNSSASLVGGDGITVSGSNISVDHDGEGLTFAANQLALELADGTLSKSGSGLKVATGGITNTEINASAAIAYSKLALSGSILNADINASAAIAYSKLALSNSIVAGDLTSNSVTEAKIASSALGNGLAGGGGTTLSVTHSPSLKINMVAGESFAANTTFAVRIAMTGETAGRVYKTDIDASSLNEFYAIGMIAGLGAAAKTAGDTVDVVLCGSIQIGSSDTAFAAGEVGQPVHLKAAGAWDAVSQITYATNEASYRIGVVQETNKIMVGGTQLLGIN